MLHKLTIREQQDGPEGFYLTEAPIYGITRLSMMSIALSGGCPRALLCSSPALLRHNILKGHACAYLCLCQIAREACPVAFVLDSESRRAQQVQASCIVRSGISPSQ